jgi:hypothetical protein
MRGTTDVLAIKLSVSVTRPHRLDRAFLKSRIVDSKKRTIGQMGSAISGSETSCDGVK